MQCHGIPYHAMPYDSVTTTIFVCVCVLTCYMCSFLLHFLFRSHISPLNTLSLFSSLFRSVLFFLCCCSFSFFSVFFLLLYCDYSSITYACNGVCMCMRVCVCMCVCARISVCVCSSVDCNRFIRIVRFLLPQFDESFRLSISVVFYYFRNVVTIQSSFRLNWLFSFQFSLFSYKKKRHTQIHIVSIAGTNTFRWHEIHFFWKITSHLDVEVKKNTIEITI